MLKIIFFLVLILGLGSGFAWLADRPGNLVLTVAGNQIEVSLIVAAAGILAIIVSVMVIWWLIKSILTSPQAMGRYFRARKRDRGYQALSGGLIAAGAGNADLARRLTKKTDGLLSVDQEPLVRLLDAQTAILEGNHNEAQAQFADMLDNEETRLLGLRGLYLEAQRMGETEAVTQYAEKAAQEAPQLAWATNATLKARSQNGDWDRAIAMIETRRSQKQIDKPEAARKRAVLLTAKAMTLLATEPKEARNLALEAVSDAPDLVPAAITASEALFALGDLKKGSKVLEAIWKKDPHPQVGQAYLHARSGDSAEDRLKRAEKLAGMKQNNPESLLLLAEAHLGTGDFTKARQEIEAVVGQRPSERAWLMLADIEDAETNDQARVRQWLSNAVKAPRDPQWTADGYASDKWAPISPVTGELDAFEWKVPVARIGGLIDHNMSADNAATETQPVDPAMLALITTLPVVEPVAASTAPEAKIEAETDDIVDATIIDLDPVANTDDTPETPAEAAKPPLPDAPEGDATKDGNANDKKFSWF